MSDCQPCPGNGRKGSATRSGVERFRDAETGFPSSQGACSRQSIFSEQGAAARCEIAAGVRNGLPVAAGYLVIGTAFGVLAVSAGFPALMAVAMSVLVFAGASQFMAVNLAATGVSLSGIILATLVVNIRHLIMSSSLTQRLPQGLPGPVVAALAFGITDEVFAIATLGKRSATPAYLFALEAVSYTGWVGGTIVGAFLAAFIPRGLSDVMSLGLYFMFAVLIAPGLKELPLLAVAAAAALLNTVFTCVPLFQFLQGGWSILLSAVAAATLGAWLTREEGGRAGDRV